MSETRTAPRVATAKGRSFLIDTGIIGGRRLPRRRDKDAYDAAAAQAVAAIAAANQVLSAQPMLPEVTAVQGAYVAAGAREAAAARASDWVKAQQELQAKVAAAQAVVAAKATGERNAYQTAAAKAQPTVDAAARLLAAASLPSKLATVKPQFDATSLAVTTAVQGQNYAQALQDLPAREAAAKAVLVAKGEVEAVRQKNRQYNAQKAAYAEMAPILADVKRSNVPQGMAKQIGQNHKNAEPEFKTYLAKLQELEDAKHGVDPAKSVNPILAGTIKGKCQEVVGAAQAYLAHYDKDLTDQQKSSKENLSRKQHCEEGIKSASQYALAMEIDIAGEPTQNNQWDLETQMRVAGARATFSYEQGNKKLQGLDDDGGGKGASDSYWVRSKSIAEVGDELRSGNEAKGSRAFIFKPSDGEKSPSGMQDPKGAGAAKEALASSNAKLFAAQNGIDLGVPETTVVSMGQYAIKNGDLAGPALIGSAQQLAAGTTTEVRALPNDTFKKIKPREVQKIALLDIMSLSMDRHGGNIMVDTADPNDPKLVPIDHGGTLPSRGDFPKAKNRMGGVSSHQFQDSTSPTNVLLQIPSAFEPFDPDILAGIDLLDPATIEADMKAQVETMDQVHPGLNASQKVGADSRRMSKRSMMFLKKAAKVMSPAEVQIALAQHGEALFDATDANFDTVANQVIADMTPKKEAYQEVMGLTENQLYEISEFLLSNGWVTSRDHADDMIMSEPKAVLSLFKSKTANAAALARSPFDSPKSPQGQPLAQADIDTIKTVFPNIKNLRVDNQKVLKEQYAAYQEYVANGWTGADVARVVQAVGGTPPNGPVGSLAIMKAWAELQKPDYQQELARLPLDAAKTCFDNLKELIGAKGARLARAQIAANAAASAGVLDPTATTSRYATDLLAKAKTSLDLFSDPANAAPLLARWQQLTAKLAQGPVQNQSPQDFAKEVESDATGLSNAVTAAALEDVRLAHAAFIPAFQGLRAPDNAPQDVTTYFKDLEDIKLALGGAGNLKVARDTLLKLQTGKQAMLAIAVPVAAAAQTGPAVATQAAQPQVAVQPLGTFDWDQATASAVKKQAVQLRLFKDKDTGMSDALKAVNKARDAADNIDNTLSDAKKINIHKKAEDACTDFSKFVNGKLRGLSKDPRWGGYCDSAADEAESDYRKFKGLREQLQ